jgi:hypothetical protein
MESPKNGIRSGPRRAGGRKKIRVRQAGRIEKYKSQILSIIFGPKG